MPKGKQVKTVSLRTPEEVNNAQTEVFILVRDGKIDTKTADVLNTCLKNSTYLAAKLPMQVLDLFMRSSAKRMSIPKRFLPLVASAAEMVKEFSQIETEQESEAQEAEQAQERDHLAEEEQVQEQRDEPKTVATAAD